MTRARPTPAALLLGFLGASVLLFAKLAEDVANREKIVSIDSEVTGWLHAQAIALGTGAMSAITDLGGASVLLALTLAAAAALLLTRRAAHAALMGAALLGGEQLNQVLKAAFERPRPALAHPVATAAGFSFPSGHAMVSMTVYGALAYVVAVRMRSRRARALVVLAVVGLLLAIGFSRVYLGVHYMSDVLAAYCAGLAWLTACVMALRLMEQSQVSSAGR